MFSDVPPALEYTFIDCCQNQGVEPRIRWGTNQTADNYCNSFNLTQRSHQQSLSNWQRRMSNTLVISECNPLIPDTACFQNRNNSDTIYQSCSVAKDCFPPTEPQMFSTSVQSKQTNKTEEKESEPDRGNSTFPKWQEKGGKASCREKEQEKCLLGKNDEKKLSSDANYELLSKKIDTWAKINCNMIRDLSRKISDTKCSRCKKNQDKLLPFRDPTGEEAKEFEYIQKQMKVVCKYEEILDFRQTCEVKTKPKKSPFNFWKKIKQRIKRGSRKKQNEIQRQLSSTKRELTECPNNGQDQDQVLKELDK